MIQSTQCGSQIFSWFTKYPPCIPVGSSIIQFSFRANSIKNPLQNFRKVLPNFFFRRSMKVCGHVAARGPGQITAVSIGADMPVHSGHASQTELTRLCRSHEEP